MRACELKYALGLLHFNLEFVAGVEATYHLNVRESLEPLLDLLAETPWWKVDLELQGFYVEFLEARYPEVLDKLRRLVRRGQVELIVTHYSDQIYLAYPEYDMEKSQELVGEILERNGLERSRVFFTQENFFTPAAPKFMEKHGFEVALIDYRYYNYFHRTKPDLVKPLYSYKGVHVLVGPPPQYTLQPLSCNCLRWLWYWYGDGEHLLAEGSPYSLLDFRCSGRRRERMRMILNELRDSGYRLVTVSEFVSELLERGCKPTAMGEVLEGAWNMPANDGVYLWMGRYRSYWEMDVQVRSLSYKSRKYVLAAETLVNYAEREGEPTSDLVDYVKLAWKHQLRAECSDPTGWSPLLPEVGYAVNNAYLAEYYARLVIGEVKRRIGLERVVVDTMTGRVEEGVLEEGLVKVEALPIKLEFVGCEPEVEYLRSGEEYVVRMRFRPKAEVAGVKVPLIHSLVSYSHSLNDEEVETVNLDKFDFNHIYLPLPNGLISLDERMHLVKVNEKMHVAVRVDKIERSIGFLVEGAPSYMEFDWELRVLRTSLEEALRRALEINVWPRVQV